MNLTTIMKLKKYNNSPTIDGANECIAALQRDLEDAERTRKILLEFAERNSGGYCNCKACNDLRNTLGEIDISQQIR